MRHAKWLLALYSICFVAIAVLLFQSLFSVSDVIVTYSVYTDSETLETAKLLQEYKGENLIFLNTEKIKINVTENTLFKVESIKKSFPNKLLINLKSCRERFAVKTSSGYVILDDEYMVCDIRNSIDNSSDGLNNILIEFENEKENFESLKIKDYLSFSNHEVLQSLKYVVSSIDSPRDFISSVRIEEKETGSNYYIYLTTSEGVEIELRKALTKPKEKTLAGVQKYRSLSDSDRLTAKIAVYETVSGDIVATFTKR